jgi:hypothetical protein
MKLNLLVVSLIALIIGYILGCRYGTVEQEFPVVSFEGPVHYDITSEQPELDLNSIYLSNQGAPFGRVCLDFLDLPIDAEIAKKIKTVTGNLKSRRLYSGSLTTELWVTDYSVEESQEEQSQRQLNGDRQGSTSD